MTTEIELKYLLLPAETADVSINIAEKMTQALTKQGYAFTIEQKKLSNYYLDTPKLALRRLDMGLRVRGIQHHGQAIRYEQTIKTAGKVIGGLHKRPEYNVDIDNDKVKLALFPSEIWQSSAANVSSLQQAIVRLFNTHFERITWTITIGDSVVELAFDHGTISCDGLDNTDVIYEIELELVSGEQDALLVLAKLLLAHFSMRPGLLSKAARGYALAAQLALLPKVKNKSNQKNSLSENKVVNSLLVESEHVHEELILEIIPMKENLSVSEAFRYGLDFSLTALQSNIDEYIHSPSLETLLKINEILALMRQGFWLFEHELTTQQLHVRDELSYFIRSFDWLENAKHVQGLVSLRSHYRKKLTGSKALISKLERKKELFPTKKNMVEFFHSERFNLLQLSLLDMLLIDSRESDGVTLTQHSLMEFAQNKLASALDNITNEMLKLDALPHNEVCVSYIEIHGLLVRSLLTGSWFSALFNTSSHEQQTVNYRRPWLDIKQGISELQTLNQLRQLLSVQPSDKKLLAWLDNKIENLLQAMEQSRVKALSIKPYWQGNL